MSEETNESETPKVTENQSETITPHPMTEEELTERSIKYLSGKGYMIGVQ